MNKLGDDPQAGNLLLGGPGMLYSGGGTSVGSAVGASVLKRETVRATLAAARPPGSGGGGGGGGGGVGKPRER